MLLNSQLMHILFSKTLCNLLSLPTINLLLLVLVSQGFFSVCFYDENERTKYTQRAAFGVPPESFPKRCSDGDDVN